MFIKAGRRGELMLALFKVPIIENLSTKVSFRPLEIRKCAESILKLIENEINKFKNLQC